MLETESIHKSFDLDKIVNVSSVPQRSPFRYAGGKTWLVPRIRRWAAAYISTKGDKPDFFVEPFAGGAITSLSVLVEGYAKKVIIAELDEDVCAVWQTIFSDRKGAEWLAKRIMDFEITYENAKEIVDDKPKTTRDVAFRTIVRNRVNHGGILAPGAGMIKSGENGKGIKSRWYPETLARRITEISAFRDGMEVIQGDGISLMKDYASNENAMIFIDPPYTVRGNGKKAGKRLYTYHQVNHEDIFSIAEEAKANVLLTYDKAEEVEELALKHNFQFKAVAMNNTHHAAMNELIIGKSLDWL